MIPILVFDIETIPDVDGLRRIWQLGPELSDEGVVDLVSQRRRQATGNDFLPPHGSPSACSWSLAPVTRMLSKTLASCSKRPSHSLCSNATALVNLSPSDIPDHREHGRLDW